MSIHVYTISGAPRGWRVLMGLALKQLEYDITYLEASSREHKGEAFLAVNPRGMVPVIQHNGKTLRDSIAILAWLDRQFPDNPLFGTSSSEAAQIWQTTMECCEYLREAVHQLLQPILVQNIELPPRDSAEMAHLKQAAELMHAECMALEKLLCDSPYLAGEQASAAEAVAFPEIRLVQRAVERKPEIMKALDFDHFDSRYPKLTDWRNRVQALPGIANTMPYHW